MKITHEILKEWCLCKIHPDLVNVRLANRRPLPAEFAMIRYAQPLGSSYAVEVASPSLGGSYKFDVVMLNNDKFQFFGRIEEIINSESFLANKAVELIKKLELPPLEKINSILPVEPISLDWLNSDLSIEDILKKLPVEKMRSMLIKHMIYANYTTKILNHLNDSVEVNETVETIEKNEKVNKGYINQKSTKKGNLSKGAITEHSGAIEELDNEFIPNTTVAWSHFAQFNVANDPPAPPSEFKV